MKTNTCSYLQVDKSSLHKTMQAQHTISSSAPNNKETSPNGSIRSPLGPRKQESTLSRSNSQSKTSPSGGDKKTVVEDNVDELKSLLPQDQEAC